MPAAMSVSFRIPVENAPLKYRCTVWESVWWWGSLLLLQVPSQEKWLSNSQWFRHRKAVDIKFSNVLFVCTAVQLNIFVRCKNGPWPVIFWFVQSPEWTRLFKLSYLLPYKWRRGSVPCPVCFDHKPALTRKSHKIRKGFSVIVILHSFYSSLPWSSFW